MKRTLSPSEQKKINHIFSAVPDLGAIFTSIKEAGGKVFLVGGAVRDLLLDLSIKDLDIEVHGLELEQLAEVLQKFGAVNFVGKSFGVFKLRSNEAEVDIALPRIDSTGRKPEVRLDPNMDIKDALSRRDVTMNAMAINCDSYELIDPFRGQKDIKEKVLRSPDIRFFVEDPLRFYRVMQFIGRFAMQPDEQLQQVCATMDLVGVSRERIEQEFSKLLLKSKQPSLGMRWLQDIGRLHEVLPEVAALVGVEQTPEWHPEGDVFQHTMQAVDAAAGIGRNFETDFDRLVLLYAALCHDLGKVECWQIINGKITNRGHDVAGAPLAKKLLTRICGYKKIIQTVAKLVRYHMDPGSFIKGGAKKAAYKRLALKLAPETNLRMLAWLWEADKRGRNGASDIPLSSPMDSIEEFIQKATDYGVLYGPEQAVLKGEDLLDIIAPGPQLGALVKKAYEIQINEHITDKEVLKKKVLTDK